MMGKISKEIGKVWRKSLTRAKRACEARGKLFLASLPSLALCFQPRSRPFCLTARAYLNTQKYGLFCSLVIKRQSNFRVVRTF